jgi:transposase-like protein
VVQEYIAGETLYGLAKRHDLSRQLIRVWVEKYEAGGWTRMSRLLTSCMNTKPRSWRWSAWLAARLWKSNF